MTLQTHTKKMGSLFYLSVAMQFAKPREIMEKAHDRQTKKYLTFPSASKIVSARKPKANVAVPPKASNSPDSEGRKNASSNGTNFSGN